MADLFAHKPDEAPGNMPEMEPMAETPTRSTLPELVGIHIAKATRLPMRNVAAASLTIGHGVPGDRYEHSTRRHVTVQSRTSLDEAAVDLGSPVPSDATRRNLTISEGVVPSRPGQRFAIGDVTFEVIRPATPCRIMDDATAPGAYEALRDRAGSVCRVLGNGTVNVGDPVQLDPEASWRPESPASSPTGDSPPYC